MNQQDFLSAVAQHQPCTSKDLYEPLLSAGYYSNKPENEAIESISKYAHYMKSKGLLVNEKQTRPTGIALNVWSLAKPETETKEEPKMTDEVAPVEDEEMASDVAELEIDPEPEPRQFITRVTRLTVGPKGEDIFSDRVTHIEIDDEGSGEFIKVMQGEETFSGIRVDVDEWPAISEAIDMMMEHIKANEPART